MGELWNGLLSGLGAMLSFFFDLIPSYGVAIILLTVAVRIVLLPLSVKGFKTMRRSQMEMATIQPKIQALRRKYQGNRQKLNEEMMKVYKEHNINPLAGMRGCLPLLLQMPVFIALYQVLTRGGGGTYLPDGALKDAISQPPPETFFGANLSCPPSRAGAGIAQIAEGVPAVDCGDGIARVLPYLLIGLMALTTWYQQRQMTSAAGSSQNQQMQVMGKIMPVVLAFISWNIAAGVLLYWVTTNAWQIGQQTVMLRSRPQEGKPALPAGDGKVPKEESPPPKKPASKGGKNAKGGKGGQRGRKKRSKR